MLRAAEGDVAGAAVVAGQAESVPFGGGVEVGGAFLCEEVVFCLYHFFYLFFMLASHHIQVCPLRHLKISRLTIQIPRNTPNKRIVLFNLDTREDRNRCFFD